MGIKEQRLVESVLFSASKPVSINEIKEATSLTPNKIKKTLDELGIESKWLRNRVAGYISNLKGKSIK